MHQVLRLQGPGALTERKQLAATGHAGQHGLHRRVHRLGQTLGQLVLQVGTVDEVLLNAQV